jgi:hypothetical protein
VNERDELRVIEALQTLTGGLTVTEEDIITATGRLRDRLEPPSPRRRLPILVAAAAALLGMIGYVAFQAIDRDGNAAPPVDKPAHGPADDLKAALQADAYGLLNGRFVAGARPTSQDLAGFWLLRAPYSFVISVDRNGSWLAGVPATPDGWGTSTLTGRTWILRMDAQSPWGGCVADNALRHNPNGPSQSRRVALARDGSLHAQLSDAVCTPAEDREVWDRVGPGSPVADYLLAAAQQAEWQAAPERFRWNGLYVSPETGHLLVVDKTGSYRYYDALPSASSSADRGTLESTGEGTMAGSCAGGHFSGNLETARIPAVDGYLLPFDAIRITTTMDGCASIAAQDIWVDLYS